MRSRLFAVVAGVLLLVAAAGCSNSIHTFKTPGAPANDDDYMDVDAGGKLLGVVPLLVSGGFRAADLVQEDGNHTFSFSSQDVIGYTVSNYAAVGKRGGPVRLRFTTAETTRDGKTIRELHAPSLPLQLPRGTEHIRLLYEIRLTRTDHNMAIVASKRLGALDEFTKRLEKDPSVCGATSEVFCSWVPTGVAVRAERSE